MIFIDYSFVFSHSTLLSLVLILIFPLVECFIHEPLTRETGRPLPTSSTINKVHSFIHSFIHSIVYMYTTQQSSKHFKTMNFRSVLGQLNDSTSRFDVSLLKRVGGGSQSSP